MNDSLKIDPLIEKARGQIRRCCFPMALAVVISVLIANMGMPLILLAILAGIGWAWWRGWRISLKKPGKGK